MPKQRSGSAFTGLFSFLVGLISISLSGGLIYSIISYKISPPCANSISCMDSAKLKVENGAIGIFEGQKVNAPVVDLAETESKTRVLGDQTATGEKHIYVDLTSQTLTAYQGDTLFMTAPVSTGKWHPTPTGDFTIWEKLKATRMTGGTGADFYDLPNVPWVMFFSGSGVSAGDGFSLHGAYWHNNFGHPMSHGCVNMRIVDAEKLYYWVNPPTNGNVTAADANNPGTKITIYGQAPI